MIKSASNDTQILQLLLHDEKLSDSVSRTALKASIEHSNAPYLQACLKHLFFCKCITEGQIKAMIADCEDPEIKTILVKYHLKIV